MGETKKKALSILVAIAEKSIKRKCERNLDYYHA